MAEEDLNPVRDRVENFAEDIPEGPLGKAGGGGLAGAAGFLAVESTRPITELVPGIKQPGYHINAHGTRSMNGFERHTLTITAISQNVAEFVAKYTAAPSNVDFVSSETEVVQVDEVTERRTYSTYKITVDISDRFTKESQRR